MPVFKDLKTGLGVIRNLIDVRGARRSVADRLSVEPPLPSGTVQIGLYFADDAVNLYQVRQWYAPLTELAKHWNVAILARNAKSARALLDESPVPVAYVNKVEDLENFIENQDLRIIFYVNQNSRNFQMFRYGRMWHVFINHGESDKMYMTTNQFKAYDFALIAGDAARQRLSSKLWDFDLDARTIQIGRPQADHFAGELPYEPDDRSVVLYAPTWEGDREAAAYGSIASHGVELVNTLLSSGTHRVIYRPHPRSGVINQDYRAANEEIIASIAAANATDPTAHHVFDDGPTLGWQLAAADVAITDVSAMVYDRLAVGKPLIVARPVSELADVDENGYLGACEWLYAADAGNIVSIVDRVQHSEEARASLEYWVKRHFGDTTPGAATARFHAAVEQLIAEWERNEAIHSGDKRTSESDPFDADEDEDSMPSEND